MDLLDKKAWDDSELINTWDEALEEYKKYHSIHLSGKKLEDVLSKEEMAQVIAQRKALRQGQHKRKLNHYNEDGEIEDEANDDSDEMEMSPERDVPLEVAIEEPQIPQQPQEALPVGVNGTANSNSVPTMPLMVGVQDEGLKNLLMSWYYAGYHTGLYEGRQQAIKESGVQSVVNP